ncbi:MAG: hypothetical protein WBI82_01870 [Sphaerochaeta sp.]
MKKQELVKLIKMIFGMFAEPHRMAVGVSGDIKTSILLENGAVLNLDVANPDQNGPLIDFIKTGHGRHQISVIVAMNEYHRQCYISIAEHWDDVLSLLINPPTSLEPMTISGIAKTMEFAERFYSVDIRLLDSGRITGAPYENADMTLPNNKTIRSNAVFADTYETIYKLLGKIDAQTILSTLLGYSRQALSERNLFYEKYNTALMLLCQKEDPTGKDWEDDQRVKFILEELERIIEKVSNIENSMNEAIKATKKSSDLQKPEVLELAVETGFLERSEHDEECYLAVNSLPDVFEHNPTILCLGNEMIQRKILKPKGTQYSMKYIKNQASSFRSEDDDNRKRKARN